jgi:hypothetical protein
MPAKKQSKQTIGPEKKVQATKSTSSGSKQTSKEKYNQILGGLELKQVIVEKEVLERDVDQRPKKTTVHIQRNNEAQIADDNNSFRIRDMLRIDGINEGSDTPLFEIDLTLLLQYQSKKAITKTFLKQFSNNNLDIHSWPYFRELVQTATNKMNLPPLVLPLNLK